MGWCGGVWSEVLDLPRPLPTSLWDAGCGSEVSESSKGVSGKEWGCSGKGHGWFLGLVLLQVGLNRGSLGATWVVTVTAVGGQDYKKSHDFCGLSNLVLNEMPTSS